MWGLAAIQVAASVYSAYRADRNSRRAADDANRAFKAREDIYAKLSDQYLALVNEGEQFYQQNYGDLHANGLKYLKNLNADDYADEQIEQVNKSVQAYRKNMTERLGKLGINQTQSQLQASENDLAFRSAETRAQIRANAPKEVAQMQLDAANAARAERNQSNQFYQGQISQLQTGLADTNFNTAAQIASGANQIAGDAYANAANSIGSATAQYYAYKESKPPKPDNYDRF